MNREIRKQERILEESRIKALLQNGEYGVLSTTSVDGGVYGIPLSYVVEEESIYFHSGMEGHKVENIKANPLVSFCIVGNTKVLPSTFSTIYESVIVVGLIETVNDKEEKIKALRLLVKKYSPDFESEGDAYIERAVHKTNILKLNIYHVTGKGRLQ